MNWSFIQLEYKIEVRSCAQPKNNRKITTNKQWFLETTRSPPRSKESWWAKAIFSMSYIIKTLCTIVSQKLWLYSVDWVITVLVIRILPSVFRSNLILKRSIFTLLRHFFDFNQNLNFSPCFSLSQKITTVLNSQFH